MWEWPDVDEGMCDFGPGAGEAEPMQEDEDEEHANGGDDDSGKSNESKSKDKPAKDKKLNKEEKKLVEKIWKRLKKETELKVKQLVEEELRRFPEADLEL